MKGQKELTGYIHSLESFGSVDGPGVRYVIFMSGCAMRCQFCHNPDTWNMHSGTQYTAGELLAKARKYRSYWGSEGGITVSGGEPLLQIDFLTELFRKAKEEGIHTALDTSGNPFTRKEPIFEKFHELLKYTDLILLDIKHIDEEQHRILTGCTNSNILDMAEYLSEVGKPVWIRHVLVPGRSDKDEYLKKLDFPTIYLGHISGRNWGLPIRWRVWSPRPKNAWTMPDGCSMLRTKRQRKSENEGGSRV